MGKSFKKMIKRYFAFLKKDRDGVMVLIALILFAIVGHVIVSRIEVKPNYDLIPVIQAFEKWENEQKEKGSSSVLFKFNPNTVSESRLDSLTIPDVIKKNIIKYRNAGGKFGNIFDLRKIYGMNDSIYKLLEPYLILPDKSKAQENIEQNSTAKTFVGYFDPNVALPEELSRFGFSHFQISNIIHYRERGGIFTNPHDVLKIYGIDSSFFLSVLKHIKIKEEFECYIDEELLPKVCVELNTADSLDLVKLRGIGPVYASRILKYRDLLGGFYSTDQLLEVYGFPEETYTALKEYFSVDTFKVEKLRINFVEYSDLIRHPYMKKESVQTILNYRQNRGPFFFKEQILNMGLLDSVSYVKISPYLTCR